MSGAVGSTPRYTRRGEPVLRDFSSLARSSASGTISATPFFKYASCSSTGLNCIGLLSEPLVERRISLPCCENYPAPFDFVIAFEDDFHAFGVDAVFFFQDSLTEGVLVIGIFDGNDSLENDRTGIEIFVDEVHGTAGEFHAVLQRLLLRFEPGKRGQ